jgi:hypothetical protein
VGFAASVPGTVRVSGNGRCQENHTGVGLATAALLPITRHFDGLADLWVPTGIQLIQRPSSVEDVGAVVGEVGMLPDRGDGGGYFGEVISYLHRNLL